MSSQLAGAAVNALLSFALLILLARWLGPVLFGEYVATLSIALVALIVIEAGWPSLLYREGISTAARARADHLAGQAGVHVASTTLVLALAAAALWPLAGGRWAAIACMGCVAGMNLVSARMRAQGRFALEALWQVTGRVASAAAIAVAVTQAAVTNTGIFLAWAAALVACLVAGAWRWLPRPRRVRWTQGLALAVPFLLLEGALAFLLRSDVAVLAASGLSAQSLAEYAACTRFTEAGLLLFAPMANVLVRELRVRRESPSDFHGLLRLALIVALVAGLAAVALSAAGGRQALVLAFGADYGPAAGLFPYVAAMLPFAMCNLALVPALIAVGAERTVARVLIAAAVAMPLALAAGMALAGAAGAALALAGLHVVVSIACLACLRRAAVRT